MSTDVQVDPNVEATETSTPRRGKPSKPSYPVPEGGLTAIPADWSSDAYNVLKPSDFHSDHQADFHDWKASYFDAKAAEHRKLADNERKYGNNPAMKKLSNISEKLLGWAVDAVLAGAEPSEVIGTLPPDTVEEFERRIQAAQSEG